MNKKLYISEMPIESERLILRKWRDEDLLDLYEFACVPGVGENAGWSHHESMKESIAFLCMFKRLQTVFCIEYREDGKAIGTFDFDWYEGHEGKGISIGYSLSKKYWGRGIMTEAVGLAIKYLIAEFEPEYLIAGVFKTNPASSRVLEKNNFVYVSDGAEINFSGELEPSSIYKLQLK